MCQLAVFLHDPRSSIGRQGGHGWGKGVLGGVGVHLLEDDDGHGWGKDLLGGRSRGTGRGRGTGSSRDMGTGLAPCRLDDWWSISANTHSVLLSVSPYTSQGERY